MPRLQKRTLLQMRLGMLAQISDLQREQRVRRMCQASERRQKTLPAYLVPVEQARIAQVVQYEKDRAIRIRHRVRTNERRTLMFGS